MSQSAEGSAPVEAAGNGGLDGRLFPVLSEQEVRCLLDYGAAMALAPGDAIYVEGQPENEFYIVLEGEVQVTRRVAGEEMVLVTHRKGQFTGALSFLTGGKSIATGRAVAAARVLRIDTDSFLKLIGECPDVARVILSTMAARRPEAEQLVRQRENLAALGKLSAGLAHELNNPAAAAGRAAAQLKETLRCQTEVILELCRHAPTQAQLDRLIEIQREAMAMADRFEPLDPLTQSDREEELADWLDARSVADATNAAGALVGAGLDKDWLALRLSDKSPECLPVAVRWIAVSLSVRDLLGEVEESAKRISALVQAIKAYSYRDQAPLQEIDIHDGIESTLVILGHDLKKKSIELARDYDRTLPRITAYGSELNQVWTNLIGNAIDALAGPGHIGIRTAREGGRMLVEIADDGPGIPPGIQPHVFDPFFTTKDVGSGTGLGLDIAYRIVVTRHHGDIGFVSKPGGTRFQVRLPIAQPGD